MLIENDKRGNALQLLYSDEKFAVPKNVYIIGMMNTADRSLAMLDYALRRRFAFFDIKPGFETPGFREYRMALDNEKFNKLINCVENLNGVIAYMTTEPINCNEELKRLESADYDLCSALLTMLLREDHFCNGSFDQRVESGQVECIVQRMIKLLEK